MTECASFGKLICKCGDSAGCHVPLAEYLAGCEACDGCIVFIPAITPDPDAERVARWQAIDQEYGLSQRTVDGLLGPGERIPTASSVERGTEGEERQSDRSAQPGDLFVQETPNELFRPTPRPRNYGAPAAY